MPEVKNRRSVWVKIADIGAAGNATTNINVGFPVDDVIVSSWAAGVTTAAAQDNPFIVNWVELRGNHGALSETIFIFKEQETSTPRHIYHLQGNRVIGEQHFQIRTVADGAPAQTGCQLIFCMEFIEYHR